MSSPELEKLAEYLPEDASYEWERKDLDSIGLITQATITLFKILEGDINSEDDLDTLIDLEKKLIEGNPTILAEINKLLTQGTVQVRKVEDKYIVKDPKENTQELMKIKIAEVYVKKKKDKEEVTKKKKR